MRRPKFYLLAVMAVSVGLSLNACKSKKVAAKPTPTPVKEEAPAPTPPPPAEEKKEEPAPVEKPNFNFRNIQFEFNSVVLKTGSYEILEQASKEMKKDPSVKFILNGHSSEEGTTQHNMSLSVDRANAVKTYLVNAGIDGSNLTVKGFGETKPIASNANEEGRALNRRVEIKPAQ